MSTRPVALLDSFLSVAGKKKVSLQRLYLSSLLHPNIKYHTLFPIFLHLLLLLLICIMNVKLSCLPPRGL